MGTFVLLHIPTKPGTEIKFIYTNYRGETAERRARIIGLRYGSSVHHPEPNWLLEAFDFDKRENRLYSLHEIHADTIRVIG